MFNCTEKAGQNIILPAQGSAGSLQISLITGFFHPHRLAC